MDLTDYRASTPEQLRTADLLRLIPMSGENALDIGARDGHFSLLLAERYGHVVALDLTQPAVIHPRVECVKGNAAELTFSDESFDLIFCAEVLEHIPEPTLQQVCHELERVARDRIIIGVPYKQDIRIGRTTCMSCGATNPPWGHVNSFDEAKLRKLFPGCRVESASFVGIATDRTNWLSTVLMDFAQNPYGTYDQEEACIYCGMALVAPTRRTVSQMIATKLAFWTRALTKFLSRPHGNWLHLVLRKDSSM